MQKWKPKQVRHMLFDTMAYTSKNWMTARETTRKLKGKKPMLDEVRSVSKKIQQQVDQGRVKVVGEKNGSDVGRSKYKYALTDTGYELAKIENSQDYYCSDCGVFVEPIKRPTCPKCGEPVEYKRVD